jgi:hypothetical protein
VLACYRNRLGSLRRIRAEWVAAKTQVADGSEELGCAEYDEATDTFYIAQGWYERIDNWGDYSSVAVTEGEVTHWMPLPPVPDAAPQAQPASVQEPETDWKRIALVQDAKLRAMVGEPGGLDRLRDVMGVYAAAQPRKAVKLTDDELVDHYCAIADSKKWAIGGLSDAVPFARAIEAAVWAKLGVTE